MNGFSTDNEFKHWLYDTISTMRSEVREMSSDIKNTIQVGHKNSEAIAVQAERCDLIQQQRSRSVNTEWRRMDLFLVSITTFAGLGVFILAFMQFLN